MSTVQEVASFQTRNGLSLPAHYTAFLATLDAPQWYCDSSDRRICFFPLVAAEGKRKRGLEVPIQLGDKAYPFFQLLTSHLEMWREFTGQEFFENLAGEPFSADEIAAAVCIGEDDNAALLFLAADGSVWMHHHDGCQVESIAPTFDGYLRACTPAKSR